MYIMVPEYMQMDYFFRKLNVQTKESQFSCTNRSQIFLYVNIKRSLFLYVMKARTSFVNPFVHAK